MNGGRTHWSTSTSRSRARGKSDRTWRMSWPRSNRSVGGMEMDDKASEQEGFGRAPRRRRRLWIGLGVIVAVAALIGVAALAGWFGTPKPSLVGAGATFPYPLINKWSIEYQKQTGVQVNYNSIGSGGGVRQFTQKTVDFGASDAPMNATERAAAPNALHIPETIGAVTFVYNLPGVPTGLNLTGPV